MRKETATIKLLLPGRKGATVDSLEGNLTERLDFLLFTGSPKHKKAK